MNSSSIAKKIDCIEAQKAKHRRLSYWLTTRRIQTGDPILDQYYIPLSDLGFHLEREGKHFYSKTLHVKIPAPTLKTYVDIFLAFDKRSIETQDCDFLDKRNGLLWVINDSI